MKIIAVIVALHAKHKDLEIPRFLNAIRSFVHKVTKASETYSLNF